MSTRNVKSKMYAEAKATVNYFVGCGHNCSYCKPSFQRQMKRQKNRCQLCYDFQPHFHPSRLTKPLPRTNGGELVFIGGSGDIAYATIEQRGMIFGKLASSPRTTCLVQSKNPRCFFPFAGMIPENVILGTTIETNRQIDTKISLAPPPFDRFCAMAAITHPRKAVTIEPIMDFDLPVLSQWIEQINPEIVWVGYDNYKCDLPEPHLTKTNLLIDRLREFTTVKKKSIREAWS